MAWRRPGDKPLSERMMVRLPTHTCIARPQWVNQPLHASHKMTTQISCSWWWIIYVNDIHDDVIKWKHSPRYWPFVRGIQRSPVNSPPFLRITGPLCGEFTSPRWIPAQRPVTGSFDVFFDLRPNKWQSKQWWGRWFETPSSPLWRHCNVYLRRARSCNMTEK